MGEWDCSATLPLVGIGVCHPLMEIKWIILLSTMLNVTKTALHYLLHEVKNIHPSIFLPLHPSVGSRVGWSLSQQSSGERRGPPWIGRQSITGPHRDKRDKQPFTLTLTPKDNLESSINLTRMFLDGGRKPEYPERTHAYTGRTYKLQVKNRAFHYFYFIFLSS